jgi:hypothetical protein
VQLQRHEMMTRQTDPVDWLAPTTFFGPRRLSLLYRHEPIRQSAFDTVNHAALAGCLDTAKILLHVQENDDDFFLMLGLTGRDGNDHLTRKARQVHQKHSAITRRILARANQTRRAVATEY